MMAPILQRRKVKLNEVHQLTLDQTSESRRLELYSTSEAPVKGTLVE